MSRNYDDMKLAVESLSGGKNTVLFDDIGMPSIMVVLPKMVSSAICTGAAEHTHPAFIVDGVEKEKVAISKYINIVANSRAYSLPMQDPKVYTTFDASLAACRQKGEGWGLTPFALWSAIVMWSKKNGTMPRGNNNYGKDHAYTHERGVATYKEGNNVCRTATGSGPVTWNHDHTDSGIADMNGNVWEWCAGMRLKDGEIQIIPNANCMRATCDMGASSTEWKAIKSDGSIVDPGTEGTLKYDWAGGKITLSTTLTGQSDTGRSTTFETLGKASGLTVPQIIKELALFPADESGYEGDNFYMNNSGERVPVRGGRWIGGADAGVFYSHLSDPRSGSNDGVGFRSAFYGTL